MFSWRELAVALAFLVAGVKKAHPTAHPGIGRPATAKEIAAWDIDVRPDFKGLPKGAGSVAKGMEVWEGKCASCHGIFGESNEVFAPIVGGTTKDDIKTGRVARLTDASFPGRTTLMKLSSVSTLWDYINRAMPWTQPKSLSAEEVYGVTAYVLNMGGVLPDNFTLSDQNIAEVQKLLPNRNGKTFEHGLWPGAGMGTRKPDVNAAACMKDCGPEPQLASFLPDFARDAHGNLAEQNRAVGAQKGADTTVANKVAVVPAPGPVAASGLAAEAAALVQKHGCVACHGMESKIVGPGLREIAKKYAGKADAAAYLAGKIKAGGTGVWGAIPMPAQALSEAEAKVIAQWLAGGMGK
jgi:S-disulfanyl-L-cysteine oxidoreductase SoxD